MAFFVFSILIAPIVSFAQPTGGNSGITGGNSGCDPTKGKICNPAGTIDNIPGLVNTVLKGVLQVGVPLVALAIIYCGFLFVAARGNSEKLGKAKDALLYTIIGAAILLGSWAIAELIGETVGAL